MTRPHLEAQCIAGILLTAAVSTINIVQADVAAAQLEASKDEDKLPFALPRDWKLEKITRKPGGSYSASLARYEGETKRAVLILFCGQKVLDDIPTEPRGQIGLFRGGAAVMEGMERAFADLKSETKATIKGTGGITFDLGGLTFSPFREGDATAQGMTGPKSGTPVVVALAAKSTDWDSMKPHLSAFVKLAYDAAMWRVWTSADGKHKTDAKFLKFQDGKVHLEKRDGSKIRVSMNSLDKADQQFVREVLRDSK